MSPSKTASERRTLSSLSSTIFKISGTAGRKSTPCCSSDMNAPIALRRTCTLSSWSSRVMAGKTLSAGGRARPRVPTAMARMRGSLSSSNFNN